MNPVNLTYFVGREDGSISQSSHILQSLSFSEGIQLNRIPFTGTGIYSELAATAGEQDQGRGTCPWASCPEGGT